MGNSCTTTHRTDIVSTDTDLEENIVVDEPRALNRVESQDSIREDVPCVPMCDSAGNPLHAVLRAEGPLGSGSDTDSERGFSSSALLPNLSSLQETDRSPASDSMPIVNWNPSMNSAASVSSHESGKSLLFDVHLLQQERTTPMITREASCYSNVGEQHEGHSSETSISPQLTANSRGDFSPSARGSGGKGSSPSVIQLSASLVQWAADPRWTAIAKRNYAGGTRHPTHGVVLLTPTERSRIRETELVASRASGTASTMCRKEVTGKGLLFFNPQYKNEPLPLSTFSPGANIPHRQMEVENWVITAVDEVRLRVAKNEVRHALRILDSAQKGAQRVDYPLAVGLLQTLEVYLLNYAVFVVSPANFLKRCSALDVDLEGQVTLLRSNLDPSGKLFQAQYLTVAGLLWEMVDYCLVVAHTLMSSSYSIPLPQSFAAEYPPATNSPFGSSNGDLSDGEAE